MVLGPVIRVAYGRPWKEKSGPCTFAQVGLDSFAQLHLPQSPKQRATDQPLNRPSYGKIFPVMVSYSESLSSPQALTVFLSILAQQTIVLYCQSLEELVLI